MVTTKNKHKTSSVHHRQSARKSPAKPRSVAIHASRPKVQSSRRARSQEKSRRIYSVARRTILTVIVLAMMTVILALLLISFNRPEFAVKRKIESITADYYENHFYPQIVASNPNKSMAEVLERYTTTGFSMLRLRQLLLYDPSKNSNIAPTLTEYCDENTTSIRIFPDPPFGKTDYHVDYHYDCNF